MIELTTDSIDGINFIKDFRLVEPFERENGVVIERITQNNKRTMLPILRALGLREVGFDHLYRCYIYAHYPLPFFWYKAVKFSLKAYWRVIRFLYDNGRIFKQIPASEPFSWRYFTPYTWFK